MASLFFIFLFFNAVAFESGTDSNGLDSASRQALDETRQVLKDKNAREKEINKDSRAQYVDKQVKSLGGNAENAESIYGLSADVMEELVKKTGGDPVKMMEILEKAKKDPEGFAKSLSPSTQSKIRGLAGKVGTDNTQLNQKPAK
jgi:hypothetical protein